MKFLNVITAVLLSFVSTSNAEEPKAPGPVKIEQAEKYLADGAQLLDVRTKDEWDEGRLKGAVLIPVTQNGFLDKSKAVLNKEKPVVVYCRSGRRSAMAAEQLREAGFTVYELEGGISAWEAAGKEIVK